MQTFTHKSRSELMWDCVAQVSCGTNPPTQLASAHGALQQTTPTTRTLTTSPTVNQAPGSCPRFTLILVCMIVLSIWLQLVALVCWVGFLLPRFPAAIALAVPQLVLLHWNHSACAAFALPPSGNEALLDAGSGEHCRAYAHELCCELTREQTGSELFAFAREVLPSADFQRLRAFISTHYPLLFSGIDVPLESPHSMRTPLVEPDSWAFFINDIFRMAILSMLSRDYYESGISGRQRAGKMQHAKQLVYAHTPRTCIEKLEPLFRKPVRDDLAGPAL